MENYDELANSVWERTFNLWDNLNKEIDKWQRDNIKDVVAPPIRGEITKKKLKRRGVYLSWQNNPLSCYFVQRGKRISPIWEIE